MGRSIVFFGLLYLYLWLVVQPQLIYSCGTITNFPVFYKGWPFLRDCLSYPGGVLRYVNALLPQFFYYSWAGRSRHHGSGVGDLCLHRLVSPGPRRARLATAGLCPGPDRAGPIRSVQLPFPDHHRGPGFAAVRMPLCQHHLAWHGHPFDRLRAGSAREAEFMGGTPMLRCSSLYLLLSVVSYVVSAAAFLPFALLCAIYEVLYRRRYGVGLVCLLVAAVLPYAVGVLVFHVSLVNAYTDMLPLSWQLRDWVARRRMIEAVYVLYLFPMAVALAWGLGRIIVAWWTSRRTEVSVQPVKKKAGVSRAKPRLSRLRGPVTRWTLESALLFGVGTAVAVVALDGYQRALLAVHYYACQRQWARVLQVSHRCGDKYVVINAIDRALYHTGRLNRDLFTYLQHPEGLIFTGEDHGLFYWNRLDTLIDLGLLNLAEKNFTECLEMFGEHPMILQRLALVNLAKGKIEAGRIYLEKLRQTLFFSAWAQDYLKRLAADPTLATDPQMQQLRACALRKDLTAGFYAPEVLLRALVEQGNQNRMAFEYLMAWYMMNRQLGRFVQNLERLRDFGYTEIPLLYQEAAVIYAYREKKAVPLRGSAISPDVHRRIEHFSNVYYKKYGGNKTAAFGELAAEYRGSYFFYNVYGLPKAQQ